MTGETCGTCRFWQASGETSRYQAGTTRRLLGGRCRINPPVLFDPEESVGRWPLTLADDWCGKWAGDEPAPG